MLRLPSLPALRRQRPVRGGIYVISLEVRHAHTWTARAASRRLWLWCRGIVGGFSYEVRTIHRPEGQNMG